MAAFKAAIAPVNTNYRCGADEIAYLFDNADAEAVVFHASFTDLLAAYKAPRSVVTVDSIARAANGKVDDARLKQAAADRVGPDNPS